jgi:hypothetical protein
MDDTKLEELPVECHEAASSKVSSPSKTRNGVVLIPQPSDSTRDPLNWPQRKKYLTLVILSLSAFVGTASSLANQLGFAAQADLYGKTLVEMSYSVCTTISYHFDHAKVLRYTNGEIHRSLLLLLVSPSAL